MVSDFKLQLMRAGNTVTAPLAASIVHGAPVTSRKESGGTRISSYGIQEDS